MTDRVPFFRYEWWACKPWGGGEWFAELTLTILGVPIRLLGNFVHGPYESAHKACMECERQMFLEGKYADNKRLGIQKSA
jgi:hypothetical protein